MCVWVVGWLPPLLRGLKRTKINVFWKNFKWRVPKGTKFQKTLILVFEVIVQPPKHTFEIGFFLRFSSFTSSLSMYWYILKVQNDWTLKYHFRKNVQGTSSLGMYWYTLKVQKDWISKYHFRGIKEHYFLKIKII